VAWMSIIETPVEILQDIDLGDERPHMECCRRKAFLCGAPYHLELSGAIAGLMEKIPDDTCDRCVEKATDSLCPPWYPTHMHCPLAPSTLWVPRCP
jgi:hypothetical protein